MTKDKKHDINGLEELVGSARHEELPKYVKMTERVVGGKRTIPPEEWYVDEEKYFKTNHIRGAETCFEGFMMDGRLLVNLGVKERRRGGLLSSKEMFACAEEWFGELDLWDDACQRWEKWQLDKEEYAQETKNLRRFVSNGYRMWGRTIAYLARIVDLERLEIEKKSDVATTISTETADEKKKKAFDYFKVAIDKYTKAVDIGGEHNGRVYYDKGVAYYRKYMNSGELADLEGARNCFLNSGEDVMGVLVNLDEDAAEPLSNGTLLYGLLDNGRKRESSFFNETVADIDATKRDKYKEIYIRSIYIISRLKLEGIFETDVVHYTSKEVAQKLLFDREKFMLSDVNRSGDEQEGKVLFDYLFGGTVEKGQIDYEYGAFAGCFTFGSHSLTHFKIFGSKGSGEGKGLSLVFRRSFFGGTDGIEKDLKEEKKNVKGEKFGIYRCAYFDPDKGAVVSMGQVKKEFYGDGDIEYKQYAEGLERLMADINKKLDELKKLIGKCDESEHGVVRKLLLKLSYLVKDVFYADEQECRIVQICHLSEERGRITPDKDYGMFVQYEPEVAEHVAKICFGPKMEEKGKFEGFLKYKGLDIPCYRSRGVVATKK